MRRLLAPLIVAIVAVTAFQLRVRHEMVDFAVYRQAAERVMDAKPLYQEGDGHYQFKYLPAFALLAVPFALVDEEGAKVMWFALSVGALVLLVRWSVRFLPERRRRIGVLATLTTIFMAKFYAHELILGQSNIFFAVLIVCAIGALQVDADRLAGALIGAAVCIKPYALLFAPWLVVINRDDNRRALIAFATVCFIALIAPAAIYGFKGNFLLLADWWRTVSQSTAPNLTGADNVSFAAMWTKWLGPGSVSRLLAGLTSAAGLAVVIDAWWRRPRNSNTASVVGSDADVNAEVNVTVNAGVNIHINGATMDDDPTYLEAAALLLLIPLLSPQGWDYVLLLGTPAIALLFDRIPELSRGWKFATWTAIALMGLTTFDLLGRAAYGRVMSWSLITLCAIGVLASLNHLRRAKLA